MQKKSYKRNYEIQVPELGVVISKCKKEMRVSLLLLIIAILTISVHELLRRGNALTLNPTSISLMQEHAFLKEKDANDVLQSYSCV